MRVTIIDEKGFRTQQGERVVLQTSISQFHIPDKMLQDFKTAYEIWLEEQKTKGEPKPLRDTAEASNSQGVKK